MFALKSHTESQGHNYKNPIKYLSLKCDAFAKMYIHMPRVNEAINIKIRANKKRQNREWLQAHFDNLLQIGTETIIMQY